MTRFEKRLECGVVLSCTVESDSLGNADVIVGVHVPDVGGYFDAPLLLEWASDVLGQRNVGLTRGHDVFLYVHVACSDAPAVIRRMSVLAGDIVAQATIRRAQDEEADRARRVKFAEIGAAAVEELAPLVRALGLEPVVESAAPVVEATPEQQQPVDSGGMRVKTFDVLERAVEEGVSLGWRQAHKYVDRPSEDAVIETITDAVMLAICEWFTFSEES